MTFFWVGHFDFFFASSPWKLVTNYVLEWMEVNFYDYDNLQPKITPPRHFSRQCTYAETEFLDPFWNSFVIISCRFNNFSSYSLFNQLWSFKFGITKSNRLFQKVKCLGSFFPNKYFQLWFMWKVTIMKIESP